MKKRPEIRRLRFECLENRAMLAGNVVVSVVHHTLLIQGDGNTDGNAIIVSQTGRRSYTVTQDSANATTINGVAGGSFSAGHIRAVQIIMGAGGDSATVNGDRLKKLDINLGDGANSVNVNGARAKQINVTTGSGQDTVAINTGRVKRLNVNTGDAQDTVNVASTRLKKVNVNLGASDDNLKFVAALPHWRKSTVDGGTGTNTLTTPGKVITANGSFHHHDPDYRLTVLDFSNFA
jgi:hypothetical protein